MRCLFLSFFLIFSISTTLSASECRYIITNNSNGSIMMNSMTQETEFQSYRLRKNKSVIVKLVPENGMCPLLTKTIHFNNRYNDFSCWESDVAKVAREVLSDEYIILGNNSCTISHGMNLRQKLMTTVAGASALVAGVYLYQLYPEILCNILAVTASYTTALTVITLVPRKEKIPERPIYYSFVDWFRPELYGR